MTINEHTNAYFKCNKILKLSDQYKLQVLNYIFQILQSNIDEKIESSFLINSQIRSHNTRTNNQLSILRVNRSKTKHCVLHNVVITWNSLPDIFKVNVSFFNNIFNVILSGKILENIDPGRQYDCIFFLKFVQLRCFKCDCFWFLVFY